MPSCSLCFSKGTNKTTCPLNVNASNHDCESHYNAKIIQRVLNYEIKPGENDCRNENYNPQISTVQKIPCEDKKITGNEYFINLSPNKKYLKTAYLCGKGSFKKVFLAIDLSNAENSNFVIWSDVLVTQEVSEKLGISLKEIRLRLLNELKVMGKNNHPNVIELKDSWYNKKTFTVTFITEHLIGGDLEYVFSKRIKNNFAFTKIELSKIFKDALQGLKYIHARGLVHRDLKPGNIGIGNDANLKLLDFGLCSKELGLVIASSEESPKLLRQLSVNSTEDKPIPIHTLMGTPEYLAPEIPGAQIVPNGRYNEKIDIYAFGIMALEFITFRYQLRRNVAGFLNFLQKINKLYQNETSSLGEAKQTVSKKAQILKLEYRRFLELSEGLNFNEDDISQILSIYEPYGKLSESFRHLVEDCITHPNERLGAKELLQKYWKHNKILKFGR